MQSHRLHHPSTYPIPHPPHRRSPSARPRFPRPKTTRSDRPETGAEARRRSWPSIGEESTPPCADGRWSTSHVSKPRHCGASTSTWEATIAASSFTLEATPRPSLATSASTSRSWTPAERRRLAGTVSPATASQSSTTWTSPSRSIRTRGIGSRARRNRTGGAISRLARVCWIRRWGFCLTMSLCLSLLIY